jgi:glycine/D-amino acid oxidase-like deaminating enzyme
MPTRYGRSPWIDQFPKSRVPAYPRQKGPLTVDLAIVGGGLTGCATAYAAAAAGMKVALFERDRIGGGTSGASSGWIADAPGVSFGDLEKTMGRRDARHVYHAWRRAARDFAAVLRRLDIKCHLEPRPSLLAATTPEQAAHLKREHKLRKEAGLDAALITARALATETALPGVAALRARDGATIDPYRATLGLAAAAAARGAQIFEQSPIVKTTFTRKIVDAHTRTDKIRARRVVVTTGEPPPLFHALARHFWSKTAYLAVTDPVPPKIRQTLGTREAVIRDGARPPHTIRWVDDERLMVMGADEVSPPSRQIEKLLVSRIMELMYEMSTLYPDISGIMPAYGWSASYGLSAEGIPYIGPHRNFPFHLFAFGDSGHGITAAYLASRILLRYALDDTDPADEAFRFRR